MPAKSAAQQKAAGAALSAKRGETPKRELKGASKEMVEFDERGGARAHGLDQAQGQARARGQGRLSAYSSAHSRSRLARLFDNRSNSRDLPSR